MEAKLPVWFKQVSGNRGIRHGYFFLSNSQTKNVYLFISLNVGPSGSSGWWLA